MMSDTHFLLLMILLVLIGRSRREREAHPFADELPRTTKRFDEMTEWEIMRWWAPWFGIALVAFMLAVHFHG
jgi:hypothetical protein